jgi:hypothetical protein
VLVVVVGLYLDALLCLSASTALRLSSTVRGPNLVAYRSRFWIYQVTMARETPSMRAASLAVTNSVGSSVIS